MAAIIVGMADLRACKSPESLTTLGLGSCIGVCIYDRITKTAGMVHIMLPSSNGNAGHNRAKFADSGVEDLVKLMCSMGANRAALTAKIAGGSHMFANSPNNILKVGERNAEACLEKLKILRIPVQAQDVGGTHGRTIEFFAETGALKVRSIGAGERFI